MKWLIRISCLLVFAGSIGLIVTGQRSIGIYGLMNMLFGLVGILFLIYLYNRQYQ